MATIVNLVQLLEKGAARLSAAAIEARRAGDYARSEGLRGEADAFLLLAVELQEREDAASLLDALYGMEQAAIWTARLDEQKAAELDTQGDRAASRYHAKSARYSHGLIRGYQQARLLLCSACES